MTTPVALRAVLLAGAMMVAGAAVAAETPSFDCATARTARETVTCRDARLARADRDMAAAYAAARKRLRAPAAEALRADQKRFLEGLESGFDAEIWFKGNVPENPKTVAADLRRVIAESPETLTGLRAEIAERTAMLRAVRDDLPGFVGTWRNAAATLTIAPASSGVHAVRYTDPSYGWPKYECSFSGLARPDGAGLIVDFDQPDDADALPRGHAHLDRAGPFLDLVETTDETKTGDDREYWICNHQPGLKGRFFAVEATAAPAR